MAEITLHAFENIAQLGGVGDYYGKDPRPIRAIQNSDGTWSLDVRATLTSGQTVNDFSLEVSRGNVTGMSTVNKFGRSTNVDSGVATDIWDRANAANDQDIWVAPTQARVHNIVSADANDDGDPLGTGARTIQVYGLANWGQAEISEVLTMNGAGTVATTNAYVIIHRIKVLTAGASGPNAGLITATAVTDNSVTAQINAGQGQTQMAIYGIPSTQTAYMTGFYVSALRANAATAFVDAQLLFNPEPGVNASTYLVKHSLGVQTTGANPMRHIFDPPKAFPGPGIIKMQAAGSADNLDISAGFDLFLVNN